MKIVVTSFIITIMLILAILIGNLLNIINVKSDELNEKYNIDSPSRSSYEFGIGDSFDNLMWFIQISDLHISIFNDLDRSTDLKQFCDITVNAVKPDLVIASGDLTDSKESDGVGSSQFITEWQNYKGVLDTCKSLKKIKWLDVRGNHDNFDVPGINSTKNYFRKYSSQGSDNPKSYVYHLKKEKINYSFMALDACPNQGLKRPFNFVGILPETELNYIEKLLEETKSSDYVIWFGHYPTSCILSDKPGIRNIIGKSRNSIAYLCGHLHTFHGFVPNMYTLQKQGFLELELGDWKDNRIFRIAAIDHGFFSIVDVKHNTWPIILVTNPKGVLLDSPHEDMQLVNYSTHIRILAFSSILISKVKIKINNQNWQTALHVKGPLYVLPWDPQLYNTGIHTMEVVATDEYGREKAIKHSFAIDGTKISFGLLPRIILMSNISQTFQLLFGLSVVGCILPICFFRYLNIKIKDKTIDRPNLSVAFFQTWLKRIWILANIDRFYYPIILYPVYLIFGPWCIGELIMGHIGAIFAWGIFINNTYIPGSFTYTYGFLQLTTFQWPFMLALAHKIDRRLCPLPSNRTWMSTIYFNIPMILIAVSQLVLSYCFWLSYGTMALILGPIRTWPLILIFWSWREVSVIPDRKIREAGAIWLKSS